MTFQGPVRTSPLTPLSHPEARYRGFQPEQTEVLPEGYRHLTGALTLPCDILRGTDLPLPLRDGTTLSADVFRPVPNARVPAIAHWAPSRTGPTGSLDRK